jgi:starch synthase
MAFLYAVKQALQHYADERIWKRIQLNGMVKDFSWKTPAAEYAKIYEAARVARGLSVPAGNQIPVATSN